MTTMTRGQAITLTSEWFEYDGGPAQELTSITIAVLSLDGSLTYLPATPVGISSPATGNYAYTWIPAVPPPPGTVLVQWAGIDSSGQHVSATEQLTVIGAPTATPTPTATPSLLDDRFYISRYATQQVGFTAMVNGVPTDVAGNAVTCYMTNADTQETVFTRAADHIGPGIYGVTLSGADTSASGSFDLTFSYLVNGAQDLNIVAIQIGPTTPDYDALSPTFKAVVESVWHRFADLFDSALGGPYLQTQMQTHFTRGRIAQLMRIGVGRMNTVAQPHQSYTIDDATKPFPVAQWGALLEQMTYCVAPETRVLRADLSWVPAGDLLEGDELVAFDEQIVGGKFRTTSVQAAREETRARVRVETARGPIYCTPDHRFVVRYKTATCEGRDVFKRKWVQASDLIPGRHMILSIGEPWEEEASFDAGYLSGILDGEGCLTFTDIGIHGSGAETSMVRAIISQNDGPVLDRVVTLLKDRGYLAEVSSKPGSDCRRILIDGGFINIMRLLGQTRPARLMAHPRMRELWEGRALRSTKLPGVEVLSVQRSVDGPVSVIQTGSGTLITEGLLSHNCEVIKHLIRSYVEVPLVNLSSAVSRLDRRDYMQRWETMLQIEQRDLDAMMDTFKIANMGLGTSSAVLISGGAYGSWGPTVSYGGLGEAAARGYFPARFFG